MKRVGVFGGAFNPPHNGHVDMARRAVADLGLDRLYILPTNVSPHKANAEVLPWMRLEMAKIAFEKLPRTEVSDIELERGGKSYTVDTLRTVQKIHPEAELYLVIGSDMFLTIEKWREPRKIMKLAALAVFKRAGEDGERLEACRLGLIEKYGARIVLEQDPPPPVSSTGIREGFQTEADALPPAVAKYIKEKGLYLEDRIESFLQKNLPKELLEHIYSTAKEAERLAVLYGEDTDKARLAALLHDCTKHWDKERHKSYALENGVSLTEDNPKSYRLYHAVTAEIFAGNEFEVKDRQVLNAVRYHTTGRSGMSVLEKIIFLADATEPLRNFEEVEKLRRLADENIDKACAFSLKKTIEKLKSEGVPPAKDTEEAYKDLSKE